MKSLRGEKVKKTNAGSGREAQPGKACGWLLSRGWKGSRHSNTAMVTPSDREGQFRTAMSLPLKDIGTGRSGAVGR